MARGFRIEARDGLARTGVLSSIGSAESCKEVETPCALVLTRRGSFPNIANELFPLKEGESLVQVSLLDFLVFNANDGRSGAEVIQKYGEGLHGFCALRGRSLVLSMRAAGSQDFMFNPGSRKDQVSGDLRGQTQRVKVTVDDVIRLQEATRCEFFEPPSVAAPPNATKKQVENSVRRSIEMLDDSIRKMANCSGGILGVIQGGFDDSYRGLSARETAARAKTADIRGFVLSGFGSGESPAQFESAINAVVSELPEELPRFLSGDGSPEQVLCAVEKGVDIFDCAYPFEVAEFGIALDLETCSKVILHDGVHEKSRQPIVTGCGCYCCRKHTRGYLHHLLRVQEMLGETLICIHNLYNYNEFLRRIRTAIRQNRFGAFRDKFYRGRRLGSPDALKEEASAAN